MKRVIKIAALGILVFMLDACISEDKYQNSSGSTLSSSQGNASSSAVSSAAAAKDCRESVCYLFKDEGSEGWGIFSAFEVLENGDAHYFYEGTNGSHVQWQIANIGGAHNSVVQVTFNGNDPLEEVNDNGWFGLSVGTEESMTLDLSEFTNGAIQFDMRILENGTLSDRLELKVECVYPCTSEDFWIEDPEELQQWQSYSIPIQRLIESGLDISYVNNLFVFKPVWGTQLGQYVFQFDNIRLAKSYDPIPLQAPALPPQNISRPIYSNGTHENISFAVTNSEVLETEEITEGDQTFLDLRFIQDSPSAQFYFYWTSGETVDLTDFFHGEIVFDMKVVNYAENTGLFTVNSLCVYPCRTIPAPKIGKPKIGEWITYHIPISGMVANGLKLDRIFNTFIIDFEALTREGLHIQLNNLRWEYQLPTTH